MLQPAFQATTAVIILAISTVVVSSATGKDDFERLFEPGPCEPYGVIRLFRKGDVLPVSGNIAIRVNKNMQYAFERYLENGSRFKPKNFDEEFGGDPKVFPIPYRSGIWKINSEKVTEAVRSEDLNGIPIVVIRARNGNVRIVYLDDGTTYWLKAEDSFPRTEKTIEDHQRVQKPENHQGKPR